MSVTKDLVLKGGVIIDGTGSPAFHGDVVIRALVGRTVQEIAEERNTDPESTVMDILLEQECNVNIVEHSQSIDNLHQMLTHPLGIVIADGVYTRGRSHPRLYGAFPMLLGEFVRERKWLGLEDAIHKVTAKPAARFHLDDRGRIAQGCVADITVFDPATVRTDATYETPNVAPCGIHAVLKDGRVVIKENAVV